MHRLVSFYKAKQSRFNDNPWRPKIINFQDVNSTMVVMDAAYKSQGSGYSVTRGYPKEIVKAGQRLIPRLRTERQNRNEVSAKLVVGGRVVADEFPDWYQVLEYDRYQLATGNYSPSSNRSALSQNLPPPRIIQSTTLKRVSGLDGVEPTDPFRSYADVVLSTGQQQ